MRNKLGAEETPTYVSWEGRVGKKMGGGEREKWAGPRQEKRERLFLLSSSPFLFAIPRG